MEWLFGIDWAKTFRPELPLLEIFVRGTCMYLGIFVIMRLLLRREAGMVSAPDILLIVLLADAAQNGLANGYSSIVDGLLLVGVLIAWNLILDRLAYYFPAVERFVHPPPLPLVRNGRLLRANLRREYISHEELWTQLRAQGIENLSQVRSAQIEADGTVTVIRRDRSGTPPTRRRVP
ncbi:MAG TPA: YetF domain-containing protein [Burkholderiales bacterium]